MEPTNIAEVLNMDPIRSESGRKEQVTGEEKKRETKGGIKGNGESVTSCISIATTECFTNILESKTSFCHVCCALRQSDLNFLILFLITQESAEVQECTPPRRDDD